MSSQQNRLQVIAPPQTWNEELSRDKKYREAKQKRTKEKLLQSELEKRKKSLQLGRLQIEP